MKNKFFFYAILLFQLFSQLFFSSLISAGQQITSTYSLTINNLNSMSLVSNFPLCDYNYIIKKLTMNITNPSEKDIDGKTIIGNDQEIEKHIFLKKNSITQLNCYYYQFGDANHDLHLRKIFDSSGNILFDYKKNTILPYFGNTYNFNNDYFVYITPTDTIQFNAPREYLNKLLILKDSEFPNYIEHLGFPEYVICARDITLTDSQIKTLSQYFELGGYIIWQGSSAKIPSRLSNYHLMKDKSFEEMESMLKKKRYFNRQSLNAISKKEDYSEERKYFLSSNDILKLIVYLSIFLFGGLMILYYFFRKHNKDIYFYICLPVISILWCILGYYSFQGKSISSDRLEIFTFQGLKTNTSLYNYSLLFNDWQDLDMSKSKLRNIIFQHYNKSALQYSTISANENFIKAEKVRSAPGVENPFIFLDETPVENGRITFKFEKDRLLVYNPLSINISDAVFYNDTGYIIYKIKSADIENGSNIIKIDLKKFVVSANINHHNLIEGNPFENFSCLILKYTGKIPGVSGGVHNEIFNKKINDITKYLVINGLIKYENRIK